MTFDLKEMSRKELEKLRADVDKALKAADARDRREALKAAEKAASEFGFSLNELTHSAGGTGKGKVAKNPAAMKYSNPEDPTQTWTGKGRKPNWFLKALDSGVSPDQMEI